MVLLCQANEVSEPIDMTTVANRSSQLLPTLRAAVDRVLAERGQPTAWSVIITVLGDAIVPRGGRIWTGSLLEILALLGFGGGVLRTALSRLVADGWLEASKAGRRSFYQLTPHGAAETAMAAARIYRLGAPAWDGTLDVAIITETDGERRQELRSKLAGHGFAAVSADTLVCLAMRDPQAAGLPGAAIVTGTPTTIEGAREIAARAWNVDAVAESYCVLEGYLAPILEAADPASNGEAEALAARILLIHELRRVVLRDPDLPAPLLPDGWVGERVRRRIAGRYQRLIAPSERWLSVHALGQDGPLPTSLNDPHSRFIG